MKIGIDIGHNAPPDTGAKGIKFEDHLTTEVGLMVMEKLKALGHTVVDCKPQKVYSVKQSLVQRVNIANSARVDVFVSIHFNAFNTRAHGTEIFATSSKGRQFAKPVLTEIVKLGFFNRGIKNGFHLYVVRNTNMPAILVECCFIDSQRDMNLYNSEAMANAIVKGLTGELPPPPVEAIPDENNNPDTSVLRLQKSLNRLKISDKDNKMLDEDGELGPATNSAIENFQTTVGIQITGVASKTTWDALNEILSKPIVRQNHAAGTLVQYLQYRLGADMDGIYGPQTELAINTFQRDTGLVIDGIIGPLTWEKLIG